jgi:hypothetical protein
MHPRSVTAAYVLTTSMLCPHHPPVQKAPCHHASTVSNSSLCVNITNPQKKIHPVVLPCPHPRATESATQHAQVPRHALSSVTFNSIHVDYNNALSLSATALTDASPPAHFNTSHKHRDHPAATHHVNAQVGYGATKARSNSALAAPVMCVYA